MIRKVLIAVAIIIAAGGLVYLLYGGRRAASPSLVTSGIIEGTEVNLSPRFGGKISSLCCGEGDAVKSGQVAAVLESEDLKASLSQAEAGIARAEAGTKAAESAAVSARANLASAEADIRTADADIRQALARMGETRREMERASALFSKGYISKEAFDQAVTSHDTAAASHAAAGARREAAVAREESAEAQLSSSLSQVRASGAAVREAAAVRAFYLSRLEDMTIKSPVSGVVVFKAMEAGETVAAGQTILTVVDLDSLYARADLDETRVASIALGSPATLRVEGLQGRTFPGEVYEIGRYAEFATQRDVTRGRQDIRTFRVKVRFRDPGRLLKPGMTVEVEIRKKD